MAANDAEEAAPPTTPPPEAASAETESHLFPVVGVGASAGGLEALTELLETLPSNPGLAFLLALHLDPHHKSLLPEILARVTPINVRQVRDGMAAEVNHVYI